MEQIDEGMGSIKLFQLRSRKVGEINPGTKRRRDETTKLVITKIQEGEINHGTKRRRDETTKLVITKIQVELLAAKNLIGAIITYGTEKALDGSWFKESNVGKVQFIVDEQGEMTIDDGSRLKNQRNEVLGLRRGEVLQGALREYSIGVVLHRPTGPYQFSTSRCKRVSSAYTAAAMSIPKLEVQGIGQPLDGFRNTFAPCKHEESVLTFFRMKECDANNQINFLEETHVEFSMSEVRIDGNSMAEEYCYIIWLYTSKYSRSQIRRLAVMLKNKEELLRRGRTVFHQYMDSTYTVALAMSAACGRDPSYLTFTLQICRYADQSDLNLHILHESIGAALCCSQTYPALCSGWSHMFVGHVRILHVPSRFQYADIFTKGLPSALFGDFRSSLSIRPPPAQTTGAY
ncbi:hypothetical protein Tco_1538905 [Tanacetum coccineum]